MRAVVLAETGPPERLRLEEVAEPEPTDGQVLVRVRAAGVNFLDVLTRQGRYPQMPELPAVLGAEVAGEFGGRRVMALPRAEGYAESVAVDEGSLAPLPAGASFEEGASFLGARVVTTASTEEKRAFALEQGADEAYSYEDFAEHVRADVVLDPVGGPLLPASLGVLSPFGVLVAIGFAGGMWPPVDPALLVGRNVGLQGFYLGRLIRHRPEFVREATADLVELWEQGAIRPVVGARFLLEEAAEAHRLIEERRHVGKVVLVP